MDRSKYIEWDVVNWSRALGFWRKHSSLKWQGIKVLEIGGRYGGLSLWLAEQGADVLCTDKEKIELPQHIIPENKISGKIRYERLDALDIPFDKDFDIILFKSVLGGIGRNNQPGKQRKAIGEMYKALKPGGELFFAENLTASPLHRFFRKKFVRWGSEWRYVTIQEMLDDLRLFSEIKYTTAGFLGAFGRTEGMRKFLGYFDRAGDRIVPSAWRYIIIGVAKK
ncbi:MAG: class I SAM-dependent methyltransferase [Chlorobi bacterium]|nr:class I SAM-dependent methyltransferase [Chlorobiota bacterium]